MPGLILGSFPPLPCAVSEVVFSPSSSSLPSSLLCPAQCPKWSSAPAPPQAPSSSPCASTRARPPSMWWLPAAATTTTPPARCDPLSIIHYNRAVASSLLQPFSVAFLTILTCQPLSHA